LQCLRGGKLDSLLSEEGLKYLYADCVTWLMKEDDSILAHTH
jgi:hypothetical protein